MDKEFELPVVYEGEQLSLKASLLVTEYTHKFTVDINGQRIIFEPVYCRSQAAMKQIPSLFPFNCSKSLFKRLFTVPAVKSVSMAKSFIIGPAQPIGWLLPLLKRTIKEGSIAP